MEIKLNQYSLSLLCGLVSAITCIAISYLKEKEQETTKDDGKRHSDEEDEGDNSDDDDLPATSRFLKQGMRRTDSFCLTKERLSEASYTKEGDQVLKNHEGVGIIYEKNVGDIDEVDPAQMLEERQRRIRHISTTKRRGTIAFADELQSNIRKQLSSQREESFPVDENDMKGYQTQKSPESKSILKLQPSSDLLTAPGCT